MTEQSPAEAIFFAALEKGTAEERVAYLDAACGDDNNLRQRVERLLAAHPQVGSFLEPPAQGEVDAAEAPTIPPGEKCPAGPGRAAKKGTVPLRIDGQSPFSLPGEGVGSVIADRYKLLETLGQGGMGAVFMAQQTAPVKRLVALKLIKLGMDSKLVLTRFEAERQALALMDHPNIAKVLDAGATDSGRLFFVMELVKGVPITRFCDERQLSPRERLELFIPVCQAIQHAHQKGVIHRDIKPSNVLVALYDDRPVPKVIDFGVAKAAGSQLTDASLVTGFGAVVGTPEYMSPEQAQLNQLDIDTRSDVYALGVLLYELLTGTTPIDRKRLGQDALLEILRVIREEEPPRPSTRLSTSEALPSIAATRRTEPAKLAKLMRGELDWIVMKCLEKDRSRRYETANGLARDLERYLHDEVVEAQPPTARYRLRKFVRKHRVAITTATAFVGLLIASAGISALLAMKAKRAEVAAENKRIEAEANAEKAERVSDQLWKSIGENMEARYKTELQAAGLQLDLALGENRQTNEAVGLLQLVRLLNKKPIVVEDPFDVACGSGKTTVFVDAGPEFDRLREFATMAVLATGQTYAPLLHPITHDGDNILDSAINSKGDRLLTRGADKTARLWDPFTGRQLALLRRADEKIIDVGLSPEGATAFTLSLDGVVRLWETKDGALRAEIDPRTGRIKSIDTSPSDHVELGFSPWTKTQLSNDRVLTYEDMWKRIGEKRNFRPVELWEAKTGRFIAQLGLPNLDATHEFFGDGRWIESHDPFGHEKTLRVFSAENGQLIAKLKHDEKYGFSRRCVPILSPSGHTAATFSETGQNPDVYYVHFWDAKSWQLLSTTGPLKWGALEGAEFQLIADDLFAMSQFKGTIGIFRAATATPIAELPGSMDLSLGGSMDLSLRNGVVLDSGQLFDTRTRRRLQPPKGRKYHPEITRFAPDGRLVPVQIARGEFQFLDTMTEKASFMGSGPSFYQARLGWVGGWVGSYDRAEIALHRLPPPDRLGIPADLLELWAQVAVRGHLDDEGAFVKWDEPNWEKKRQELAAKPVPYPDFPFPGHVATDRLHWLRQDYENASDADKPRLAKQLLDRAEAAGDKAEAVRWRAIVTPKSPPTKPAAKPSEP